ncbi:hypothetical protein D4764_18G0007320, partial [Takifugu flavidus]
GNLSEGTFTKKYKNYRFTRQSDPNSHYCISINDITGLEEGRGAHVDDIILALKGHVRDGYKFNPSSPLNEGDEGYNPSPTLQDRVHVLFLSFLLMESHSWPLSLKVTKPMKDNVENLYKSKYLKQKVDELFVTVGIPLNCIFLVKNYDVVPNIKDNVDAPILCALRQIISFGERFLNDQQNNM